MEKKYLMKGVLALVLGGFVVSCADEDVYNSNIVEAKQKAYEESFIQTYGAIASDRDWGFSDNDVTAIKTRTHDKESNMWADKGYVIPDPLTPGQKDKVRRYFQQNRNPQGVAVDYTDFFVQQVYKGGTNLDGSLTTEAYTYGNGDVVTGSSNMDKLTAGTIEDHINDFNYGDRGEINVQNNDRSGEHEDAITFMVNSSTNCFGFHNSRDSHQYNDQYVIISGDDIDAWDSSGESVAGMFFVGFDYEANKAYEENAINTNMYLVEEASAGTAGVIEVPNKNDGKYYTVGGADGYYSDWIVRITEGIKREIDDNTPVIPTVTVMTGSSNPVLTTTTVSVIYMEEVMEQGRVFAEDLGQVKSNDIDFNDVVFDAQILRTYMKTTTTVTTAVYDETQSTKLSESTTTSSETSTPNYRARIKLLAAGGTLQLSVGGYEVHNLFGEAITTTTMVNTANSDQSFAEVATAEPVDFELYGYTNIKDIPIVVMQSGETVTLQASIGRAPQKIIAPIGTRWASERTKFGTDEGVYGDFESYVTSSSVTSFWESNIHEERYYNGEYATAAMEAYPALPNLTKQQYVESESYTTTSWNNGNSTSVQTVVDATIYKSPMATPASSEQQLLSQEHRFINWDGNTSLQILKADLTENGFGAGSKLRVYGAGVEGMAVKVYKIDENWGWSDLTTFDGNNASELTTDGYVEYTITVDDYKAIIAGQGIAFNGTSFTCTYITLDNTNATTDVGSDDNGDDNGNTGDDNGDDNGNTGDDNGGDNGGTGDDNGGDNGGTGDDNGGTSSSIVQLWPASGTGSETNSVTLQGSDFNGLQAGQTIYINCTFGDWWWSTTMNFLDWSNTMPSDVTGWTAESQKITATEAVKGSNYVSLTLSSDLLTELKAHGAVFWFGNMTVTSITVE